MFCVLCFTNTGLCSATPSAPVEFVARLCLILLYSVIFVLRASPHKHRVCALLFLRLSLSQLHPFNLLRFSQNFVLSVLRHKHLVCAVLFGSRDVCCTLLLLVIYVLCSLHHQHQVCAVLFPSTPLKFTPFWFSLFYWVCFCCTCFAQQAPVYALIFPQLPSNFCFVLFSFDFVFCVQRHERLINS